MGKFLRDLFATTDNCAFDLGRVGTAVALISGCVLQGYALFKGQAFSMSDYGTGMGLILGGAAALIGIKDRARTNAIAVNNETL